MRARKLKHRDERLLACDNIITNEFSSDPPKLTLTELFPDYSRFRLEIGYGKGGFVRGEAKNHPDTAYIAVELITDVIVQAAERTPENEYKNIKIHNTNASRLDKIFPAGSFERIHINFCDPWPKKRNAKRRLTCRTFLSLFKSLLAEGGCIAFKTDNADLFEYSLPEFEAAGYRTEKVTHDLHASEYFGCDTETEYEKAFSEKGTPICRLEAYPTK